MRPSKQDYLNALRILSEGIQSKSGVPKWKDPAEIAWAHCIMSQCINEVILYRHKKDEK